MTMPRARAFAIVLSVIAALAAYGCSGGDRDPNRNASIATEDASVDGASSSAQDGASFTDVGDAGSGDARADMIAAHQKLCRDYVDAMIAYLGRCSFIEPAREADERKILATRCAAVEVTLETGRGELVPASADRCLAEVSTRACNLSPSYECLRYGVEEPQSPGGLDKPCGVYTLPERCGAGLGCGAHAETPYCSVCVPLAAPPDACPCDPALGFCKDGQCRPWVAENQACDIATRCNPAMHYCGSASTCKPLVADGASCATDCAVGTCCGVGRTCSGSPATCQVRATQGSPCSAAHVCDRDLFCDATSSTCVLVLDDGSACSSALQCKSGRCSAGMCGPPAVGSVCKVNTMFQLTGGDTDCGEGRFCKLAAPYNASGPEQTGTCETKLPLGASCKLETDPFDGCAVGSCRNGVCSTTLGQAGDRCDDDECGVGFYCKWTSGSGYYRKGACTPRLATGASCAGFAMDRACALGDICFKDTCRPRGDVGDACYWAECKRGLFCAPYADGGFGGTCEKPRTLGESCGADGACIAGHCEQGTCRALAGPGEVVAAQRDCANGLALPDDAGVFRCAAECRAPSAFGPK